MIIEHDNFAASVPHAFSRPNLRNFGIELLQIYLIGSNVSNFKSHEKCLINPPYCGVMIFSSSNTSCRSCDVITHLFYAKISLWNWIRKLKINLFGIKTPTISSTSLTIKIGTFSNKNMTISQKLPNILGLPNHWYPLDIPIQKNIISQ